MSDDHANRQTNNTTDTGNSKASSVAEKLFDLFYSDATAHVEQRGGFKHIREDGKHVFEEKPDTVHTPITAEHVKAHLDGTIRLSAYPIQQNDTARWGTLDIDLYDDFDSVGLCQRLKELPLPLYPGTSKSGGGRVWLFCEEPVAASTLRKTLQAVRKSLGLPAKVNGKDPVEIYPKQETTSAKGNASSVELPYCGI
jgi:hypothetical protein